MLALALLFWALSMITALFAFAIITDYTVVIAQAVFWLFFLHFMGLFVVGWGYRDLLSSEGNPEARTNP